MEGTIRARGGFIIRIRLLMPREVKLQFGFRYMVRLEGILLEWNTQHSSVGQEQSVHWADVRDPHGSCPTVSDQLLGSVTSVRRK